MMDYTTYKVSYSNGDMFTLTGADFYGYIEYSDGKATAYNTQLELVPKRSYKTDLFTSELFFDRVVSDETITLPKTKGECLFSLNDEFSYESFKDKLDRIRYNNNFIFSRLFIPASNLPSSSNITYSCLTAVNDTSFTTRTINVSSPAFIQSNLFSTNTNFRDLGNVVDATAQSNYDDENKYAWFAATSSSFISITGSPTDVGIVEQSRFIESRENEITFGTIGGIASNDKFLFISSQTDNVIYKYDITGYLNNDTVLANKRNLLEVMGGRGRSADKFNGVTKLACDDSTLAAYDVGNREIKIYDVNFNYITKISGVRETVYAMGFDPFFKNLYVIAAAGGIVYLYRFDECYNRFEKIELEEKMIGEEVPVKIDFSRNNSNFWYLITEKRVLKKLKTRSIPFIGLFDQKNLLSQTFTWPSTAVTEVDPANNYWNNTASTFVNSVYPYNTISTGCETETALSGNGLFDNIFKGFSIFNSTADTDRIVMLSNSRLYYFYEPNKFERVLKQDNYTIYGLDGMTIDPEEYIQTSTINSELYKVIYDILTLKNNIVGRFYGKVENGYTILGDYNYNLDFSDFIDKTDQEFYIHGNEKNIVGVINRPLEKIYDLQVKLVNLIAADIDKEPQKEYNSSGTIQI